MKTNLKFTKVQYYAEDDVIIFEPFSTGCRVLATISIPTWVKQSAERLPGFNKFLSNHQYIIWSKDLIEAIGYGFTKLREGDTFDKELGKKIALTKAQKNAYKISANLLYGLKDFLEKHLFEDIERKALGCRLTQIQCEEHWHDLSDKTNTK